MYDKIKYIDSHVHIDIIQKYRPDNIEWLKKTECLPVSWAFGVEIDSIERIREYLEEQHRIIKNLNSNDVPCFYLTGIHPRNLIEDLEAEDVKGLLLKYLDDPLCLGIGEIGLEFGSLKEKEILSAHLDLADELLNRGKMFGVHTPRENKVKITRELIQLLKQYKKWSEIIVIDHCTIDTIGLVLDEGYWAGVTMSPEKTSYNELGQILIEYPECINRIMLNTDSGSEFFKDLYQFRLSSNVGDDILERLTKQNARNFFRL